MPSSSRPDITIVTAEETGDTTDETKIHIALPAETDLGIEDDRESDPR
jgi:hypothetical protein